MNNTSENLQTSIRTKVLANIVDRTIFGISWTVYVSVFLEINQSINQKVNLYSASSIKNSQTRHLHISTLKQPCLKSTLELFPGNVTAS